MWKLPNEWTEMGYQFKPNPMQQQVLESGFLDGKNIVVSAPTASGKTIIAELAIHMAHNRGKKGIYIAPMKALVEEKMEDWPKAGGFRGKNIEILTGDYTLKPEQQWRLSKADIIVMTNEMLDSRTTKRHSEKNEWLMDVGCLVVDETHLISSSGRGDKLEVALMQFCDINPEAQVVFLSATIGALDKFQTWVTSLTDRETIIVESDYRPTELKKEYLPYEVPAGGYGGKVWLLEPKLEIVKQIVASKSNEKFICFCHSVADSVRTARALREMGLKACYHNASLDLEERKEIESDFKEGELQIIASTPTLAIGVNLPARNVIIVGLHRGINLVEGMDIQQSMGRAGRPKYDDVGYAYVVYPDDMTLGEVTRHVENIRMKSVLSEEDNLMFHLLKQVYLGNIEQRENAYRFVRDTFYYHLEQFPVADTVDYNLEELQRMEMISIDDHDNIKLLKLGQIGALFYFSPKDIYAWYMALKMMMENPEWWHNDYRQAEMVVTPTDLKSQPYVKKDERQLIDEFQSEYRQGTNDWIKPMMGVTDDRGRPLGPEVNAKHIHKYYVILKDLDPMHFSFSKRELRRDIERKFEAISTISSFFKFGRQSELNGLMIRLKYGIGPEAVELVRIPEVGKVRAERMLKEGIKTPQDILDNSDLIITLFGPTLGRKIMNNTRQHLKFGK